jgi:hypothetical protein
MTAYLIWMVKVISNIINNLISTGLLYSDLFSRSLFPVTPTLDDRASVKHFVSLQFLNP